MNSCKPPSEDPVSYVGLFSKYMILYKMYYRPADLEGCKSATGASYSHSHFTLQCSLFQSTHSFNMLSSTVTTLLLGVTFISAATLPRRVLTEDDIILYGRNGRVEVMKRAEYSVIAATDSPFYNGTNPAPSNATVYKTTSSTTADELPTRALGARCSTETVFTLNPVETFLNWDVLMSQVVKANTDSTSVSVTEGFSIDNSISVSESATLSTVDQFLSTTFSISYTETWSSSYAAAYTFSVPTGKYGAVVSNPSTTRHSGYVDIGCIAEGATRTTFTADSYTSKSYDSLAWVDGVIQLCTGDTFPLPRCLGSGTL
jgi:hypothetical protein